MRQNTGSFSSPAFRAALWAAAVAAIVVYLAQHWRLKPTDTDDGLILDYIHQMSLGARPHWDMVDAYGLFNWVFPVAFYEAAGGKIWGVHLWLLVLKSLSAWLTYRILTRTADRLHGALAALLLVMLLGQGWQPLQTPYAFLTVVPLVLASWLVLVGRPFAAWWANALGGALLTTLTIWTKLNTGMYLLAGGIFVLTCVDPTRDDAPARPGSALEPVGAWFKAGRAGLALAYAAVFTFYARSHFELLYFFYLILPVLLGTGWVVVASLREPVSATRARRALGSCAVYVGATALLSLVILLGYYGANGAGSYVRELTGILTTIRYHYPFPPVGKPWFFVGYNEYFWPQLPWLSTVLFCAWLVFERRLGERTFGASWPEKRAQAVALFMLSTLHGFVLYPRSDDMHVFQALLVALAPLFTLAHQLGCFFGIRQPRLARPWRYALGAGAVVYASTLFEMPELKAFSLRPGDYQNSSFQYLDYRPPHNPRIRSFAPEISDHDWDETVDLAGRYIDSITRDDEEILVLCDVRLLHALSHTRSVGGRHAFYFYLIAVQLLDRAGFDKLVPPHLLGDIMAHPPRVIVTRGDLESFVPQFPELRAFRDQHYVETRRIRQIHVYELRH